MQLHRSIKLAGIALAICLGTLSSTSAQDLGNEEADGRESEFQQQAGQGASRYEFTVNDQVEASLVEQPLLRWSNPVGGDWDGRVYLWTTDKRPAVIASIYKAYHRDGQPISHEFHSLTDGKLMARKAGRRIWANEQGGISWKPIPNTSQLTPSKRLGSAQIRALARKFSVDKKERDGTPRQLRLLSQPVYRYQTMASEAIPAGLFVFAQTTDPEVLLLIEARATDSGPRWHYALARLNSVELRVSYEGTEVWSVAEMPWAAVKDREAPYTVFHRQ